MTNCIELEYHRSRLRPVGERQQKSVANRNNMFNKKSSWVSIAEIGSSSPPEIVPIDSSNASSEEGRDDDLNKKIPPTHFFNDARNGTARTSMPSYRDESEHYDAASIFEFDPSWDWQSCGENVYRQDMGFHPSFGFSGGEQENNYRERDGCDLALGMETRDDFVDEPEHQQSSGNTIALARPTASKFDLWSKGLLIRVAREKKLFKYQSFCNNDLNENEIYTSKAKVKPTKIRSSGHELIEDDRNETDEFVDEDPSGGMRETTGREQHSSNSLRLENEGANALEPEHNERHETHESHNGDVSVTIGATKSTLVDDSFDSLSYGDYSSVFTDRTENMPLLKAWGANYIDCNSCGIQNKARKARDAKRKKAEARRKQLEELWGRNQFYWKYESMKDKRKQAFDELDTLISNIPPQKNTVHPTNDENIRRMPIGLQLSTITECDEDADFIGSPKNSRLISIGSEYIGHNGKVVRSYSPTGGLLDSGRKNSFSQPHLEDEFKDFAHFDSMQKELNPAPEIAGKKNGKSRRTKSRKRRVVLENNEIVVPNSQDLLRDGSSDESRGGISDITEDYLHIPFSSPLYGKVLQAFREAAAERHNKIDQDEEDTEAEQLNHLVSVFL